jgi:putative ABC transport system substrate-binding protein
MMDRRRFLLTSLASALAAVPLASEAQQTGKIARVGVLGGQSLEGSPPILALRKGLRELGYVEGQTIALEWRWAQGKRERLLDLAAELVKLKVDVLVAGPPEAVQAAQSATKTIPIVMAFVSDPVAYGFVANIARPGGNITGLSQQSPETNGKRLQLLREAAPSVKRIAILSDPSQAVVSTDLRETQAAALTLGLPVHVMEVRRSGELERTFSLIAQERGSGVIVLQSSMLFSARASIAQLAMKHHLPTVTWVDAGCLMSYGPNLPDLARRAAYFVDKILKGAKPAEIPVEQPTRFELVINLKTAKALGLTIPPYTPDRPES